MSLLADLEQACNEDDKETAQYILDQIADDDAEVAQGMFDEAFSE